MSPKKIIEPERDMKLKMNDNIDDDNEWSKISSSLLDELSDSQGETSGVSTADDNFRSSKFFIGDTAKVMEEDLIGMRGKLTNVDKSTIKMKPNDATDLDENTDI